ncbi:hypothetical protein GBAR_LOCUS3499 [Geodia barretti]|nr:hypothetical protein GBAR_LOCUS3499 [Geodia barretti]
MEMEEMKDSKQRIQTQQDSLLSRYDEDIAACEKEKNRNAERLGSYVTDIAKGNTAKQRAEAELTQCNTQLAALEDSLHMKDFRYSSLQNDLLNCQEDLQTMTSQKEKIEEEMEELKRQGLPGKMAGNMDHLTDKDALFKAMSEKLSRGELLNEHEKKILELLKNGPPEEGDQKFDTWGARNARQNPYVSDGGERGGKAQRFPQIPHGQPPAAQKFRPPVGDGRFPGYNPVGGGGRGMEPNLGRVPGGMGTKRSSSEKQQLPELAEQEEVKELQIEDQEPQGRVAGVGVAGREGGGEDGDQGMDEQAFDPEEKKPGEEEEEEERDYNFDQVQEKPVENLNLPVPGGGQGGANPDPHRVVVDGGGAKVHSPPKFENPDTAFDNPDQMNEQEELEKEQNGEEEEGMNNDELAHRQFEEDMRMDREERLRIKAVPRGRGMEQGQRGWNGDRGGMEQGQQGVDYVMRQEMNVNDQRRKEVSNQLEIEELQRRLNQPRFGQRDNLR